MNCALPIGILLFTASCFSPQIQNGLFCDEDMHCPSGQTCVQLPGETSYSCQPEGGQNMGEVDAGVQVPSMSFSEVPDFADLTIGVSSFLVGSIFGDGQISDIAMTSQSYVNTLAPAKTTGYTGQGLDEEANGVTAIGIGDWDSNGLADVALSEKSGVQIYLQTDRYNFADSTFIELGARYSQIVVLDVNNDGRSDLVLVDNDASTVYVVLQNSDGTTSVETLSVPGVPASKTKLHVEDINSDGHPDIVVHSQREVLLYENNAGSVGGGVFLSPEPIVSVGEIDSIAVAKVDEDIFFDLLVSSEDKLSLYTQENDSSWTLAGSSELEGGSANLEAVDMSGDGVVDIVTAEGDILITNPNEQYRYTEKIVVVEDSTRSPADVAVVNLYPNLDKGLLYLHLVGDEYRLRLFVPDGDE